MPGKFLTIILLESVSVQHQSALDNVFHIDAFSHKQVNRTLTRISSMHFRSSCCLMHFKALASTEVPELQGSEIIKIRGRHFTYLTYDFCQTPACRVLNN